MFEGDSNSPYRYMPMDALLLSAAFLCGFIAQQFRLPPLVGFLVSGFILQAFGQSGGEALSLMADMGVTLMLFCIGLKLKLRTLMRPEIWAGTCFHTVAIVLIFTVLLLGVGVIVGEAIGLDWQTAILVAFALSFSSTVFAVKTLEESGDLGSMHGRISIGILIMQDLIAVLFLTFSTGKLPSVWAIALLFGLLFGRGFLGKLIGNSGHGEMITLCGLFIALVIGAEGFEAVSLKADLGALFVGVLVGTHPKAKELNKSLLSITDLLLVGFFLQIGLEGTLSWNGLFWALGFVALLPLKSILFFWLMTRFHLRARTSWMVGLTLSTYSEFGLIVLSLGVGLGWVSGDWLVAMALCLSFSILILSPLSRQAEELYDPIGEPLKRYETKGQHPDDLPIDIGEARIAIFGMGRVGLSAYRHLQECFPNRVIGFDRDPDAVDLHCQLGRNVLFADATDSDFWERGSALKEQIDLVVLAMPKHGANVHAAETLKRHDYGGVVAATGKFDDEVRELRELKLDTAFNIYNEAGAGFAAHVLDVFDQQRPDISSELRSASQSGENV